MGWSDKYGFDAPAKTNDEAQRERMAHFGVERPPLSEEDAEALKRHQERRARQHEVDKKRAAAADNGHRLGYEKKCQCGVECRSAREWYAHVDAL